jgi:hypothetical protein
MSGAEVIFYHIRYTRLNSMSVKKSAGGENRSGNNRSGKAPAEDLRN